MKLYALADIYNLKPCFMLPIFIENSELYIQVIDEVNNKVVRYLEFTIDESKLCFSFSKAKIDIDLPIYCIARTNDMYIIGSRNEIKAIVEQEITSFEGNDFFYLEILEFIGDYDLALSYLENKREYWAINEIDKFRQLKITREYYLEEKIIREKNNSHNPIKLLEYRPYKQLNNNYGMQNIAVNSNFIPEYTSSHINIISEWANIDCEKVFNLFTMKGFNRYNDVKLSNKVFQLNLGNINQENKAKDEELKSNLDNDKENNLYYIKSNAEEVIRLWKPIRKNSFRIINSITKDPYLTEDVLQDSLIFAAEKFEHLKDKNNFDKWFYTIATRRAYNALRKIKKSIPQEKIYFNEDFEDKCNQILDKSLLLVEDSDAYVSLVKKLPQRERYLIHLKFVQQLELDEISELTGIKLNTLKSIYHRALKKLRNMYNALNNS